MGMRDEASELLTMAQQHIAETGEKYALADVYRLQAELSKVDGDIEATEQHLNTALNVAREQGAKLWELRAAIDLARLWLEQGRLDEAIAILKPVSDSIAEGDCPDDQAKARELLDALTG